jgi:hypothetical protein
MRVVSGIMYILLYLTMLRGEGALAPLQDALEGAWGWTATKLRRLLDSCVDRHSHPSGTMYWESMGMGGGFFSLSFWTFLYTYA